MKSHCKFSDDKCDRKCNKNCQKSELNIPCIKVWNNTHDRDVYYNNYKNKCYDNNKCYNNKCYDNFNKCKKINDNKCKKCKNKDKECKNKENKYYKLCYKNYGTPGLVPITHLI